MPDGVSNMENGLQSVNGEPRRNRGGEWRVFFALALLTVAMIGGLYLIARNAASSGVTNPDELPVPTISVGDACTNFADYWMHESGVDVDASVIEGLTNCVQSPEGEWFVPTGPNDPRLPDDFALTEAESEQTAALRQRLLRQIGALESSLSASMKRDLESIYSPQVLPITGHVRDGVGISRQRSRYTRVTQAFLLEPEYELLADYVAWLMAQKIDAYESLLGACVSDPSLEYLRTVCYGIEDSMSVRFPPWTWDLRSAVSLDAYLAYLVRTNQLPDGQSTVAGEPAIGFAVANRSPWERTT